MVTTQWWSFFDSSKKEKVMVLLFTIDPENDTAD
jgi:cytochrome oxidase Cu insertion factor (SCO1/SenC/PrrC family)